MHFWQICSPLQPQAHSVTVLVAKMRVHGRAFWANVLPIAAGNTFSGIVGGDNVCAWIRILTTKNVIEGICGCSAVPDPCRNQATQVGCSVALYKDP